MQRIGYQRLNKHVQGHTNLIDPMGSALILSQLTKHTFTRTYTVIIIIAQYKSECL